MLEPEAAGRWEIAGQNGKWEMCQGLVVPTRTSTSPLAMPDRPTQTTSNTPDDQRHPAVRPARSACGAVPPPRATVAAPAAGSLTVPP
jgi:hypothetical protein